MSDRPVILFTAFEPSGDALAAPVIRELLRRQPQWEVWAFGGPEMAAAGAHLIEVTTEHAAIAVAAVRQVGEHWRRLAVLRRWLNQYKPAALVPVDSPAANWSICKIIRRRVPRARIVHLAAPQLWAWASWRIRRMRRLSDHVLCLLPFEADWFQKRRMPGTFVGHPIFDRVRATANDPIGDDLPEAPIKLAVLPGSRASEVEAHWATIFAALTVASEHELREGLSAVIASAGERVNAIINDQTGGSLPPNMQVVTGRTDEVLRWCDVALVASGTATLQVAAHGKPMVAFYHVSRLTWNLLGRWLVRTRTFTLPNLIAEHAGRGRVCPEFVPHFGDPVPIINALRPLLDDGADARAEQAEALRWIGEQYAGIDYTETATTAVEEQARRDG